MRNYRFIDYATQGYLLVVGCLILLFHGDKVRYWPLLLIAHCVCVVGIHWVIRAQARAPERPVVSFLRHFYPILLYVGFYRETGVVNQMFVTGLLDHHMIRFDQWMFGFQPSLALMDRFPSPWVSETLYIAYFSYYIMIGGVGLALFLRDRKQFFHYVSVVSFVFYCCYLTYVCLPVLGPRVFYYPEIANYRLPNELQMLGAAVTFPQGVQEGLFYRIMRVLYDYFESSGAAFPSSHVAIAIVTAWFSTLYLPRIKVFHWFMVVLLCTSTVYCRYHYVVDVLAGIVAALLLVPLGEALFRRIDRTAEAARS